MNRIEFMQTAGVPLTNELMNAIQTAYDVFNGLGGIAGNLTILDGCTDNGNQISSGVVFINGEVLRFEGGYVSEKVFISENHIKKQFKSGENKVLIKERSVRFGNAASDVYNWADFVRIEKLKDLQTKINAKAEQSHVNQLSTMIANINNQLEQLDWIVANHVGNKANPHQTTLQQLGVLKKGTIHLGDIQGKQVGWRQVTDDYTIRLIDRGRGSGDFGGDDFYDVFFHIPLPPYNYIVIGQIASEEANWGHQNDVIITVQQKTPNGFKLSVREVSPDLQNIVYDYIIIAI